MSSDFSNIQNKSSKVCRAFGKFYEVIVYYFLKKKKIGKIRNKEARVLCFVDGNNFSDFKFVQENAF